ncbi:hypothetical protein [Agromyces sp. NPDC057865]|uniref:hypothetical protein n=1 Tax=Agromyces sp. NPDC057865 TaxID=3346267 RepID=UPI003671BD20
MANHLEYVHGPLGEVSVLPCACPRLADHPRPTSARRLPTGRHLRGRRRVEAVPRASRARHAA